MRSSSSCWGNVSLHFRAWRNLFNGYFDNSHEEKFNQSRNDANKTYSVKAAFIRLLCSWRSKLKLWLERELSRLHFKVYDWTIENAEIVRVCREFLEFLQSNHVITLQSCLQNVGRYLHLAEIFRDWIEVIQLADAFDSSWVAFSGHGGQLIMNTSKKR